MKNILLLSFLIIPLTLVTGRSSLFQDPFKEIREKLNAAFQRSDKENQTSLRQIFDLTKDEDLELMLSLARNNQWLKKEERQEFSDIYHKYVGKKE